MVGFDRLDTGAPVSNQGFILIIGFFWEICILIQSKNDDARFHLILIIRRYKQPNSFLSADFNSQEYLLLKYYVNSKNQPQFLWVFNSSGSIFLLRVRTCQKGTIQNHPSMNQNNPQRINPPPFFQPLTTRMLCTRLLSSLLPTSIRTMASLPNVVEELTAFAPLSLAEKWDNVGLLIEPSSKHLVIEKVLLTNDLTERVMEEALQKQVNMIISYHPPVFAPLKRITQSNWKERIVCQCLENKIALFSPHTSWDAVEGGVNDWLFGTLNVSIEESRAISCPDPEKPMVGGGRVYKLSGPASLELLLRNLKSYAQLETVQLALVDEGKPLTETMITKIALCAGSGGSLLKDIPDADLYLTGEMSHHEVLDAVHRGTNVILTNHSNSERGFLTKFKDIIGEKLPDVEFIVSETDSDPLKSFRE